MKSTISQILNGFVWTGIYQFLNFYRSKTTMYQFLLTQYVFNQLCNKYIFCSLTNMHLYMLETIIHYKLYSEEIRKLSMNIYSIHIKQKVVIKGKSKLKKKMLYKLVDLKKLLSWKIYMYQLCFVSQTP